MAKRTKKIVDLIERVKRKTGLSNRGLAQTIGGTSAGQLSSSIKSRPTIPDDLVNALEKLDRGQRQERVFRIPKRIKKIRARAAKKSKRRLAKYQRFICRVTCDTDSFNKYTHSFNFVADGRNKKTKRSLQARAKRLHKEIFADHRPTSNFEVS
tara:strand:- start:27 stop:488 length:462 start_codon:yes stop_codon:yes gene_type:complete